MAYNPTQRDIDMLYERNRVTSMKLELMNKRYQVIHELQGECMSGTLSIQSDSDIRRTCSLNLYVKDSSYSVAQDARIWLDKLIRVWYVVYDHVNRVDRQYPLGIYTLLNGGYSFDSQSRTLALSLADLTATLSQERGSAIGSEVTINVDSDIRSAIISALTQYGGIDRYQIDEFPTDQRIVPFDHEFPSGTYPLEIIKKLRDIYPGREIYFDTDGVFVCRRVPMALSDDITLTHEILDRLVIRQSPSTDFTKVKNATEIWGMSLESDRYCETVETIDGVYHLTIPDLEVLDENVTYGFKPETNSIVGQHIKINEFDSLPLLYEMTHADGTSTFEYLRAGAMVAGISYVVRYSNGRFLYQGESDVHVMVMEVSREPTVDQQLAHRKKYGLDRIFYVINPDSPFSTDTEIGVILQVFKDGEFADIPTEELAKDRASFENWKSTRLEDSISFESIAVGWLDVNQKISLTNLASGEVTQYITKGIDFDFTQSKMSVNAARFYPYYPFVV